MKEIEKVTIDLEKGNISGLMEMYLLESGNRIKDMAMGSICGRREEKNIKVDGSKIRGTGGEYILTTRAVNTMETGIMI
jgi:hypothetical protein